MNETDETLTPRTATQLFGHNAAEARFRDAFASGRLHHAWLITGPRGIGKATLAWRIARGTLSGGDWNMPPIHPLMRRIAAGSHTDLLCIEPAQDADKDETKREISVEQARSIGEFLSLTPAESEWRVVIIDSIDQMNANAANAILKALEEPPPRALLLLVSHNPGLLLPTIRSRCQQLRLSPLDIDSFRQVMHIHAPDLSAENAAAFGALSRYSPGIAIAYAAEEGLSMYGELVRMVLAAASGNLSGVTVFADTLLTGRVHERWQILGQLTACLFERALTLGVSGAKFTEAVPDEAQACLALLSALGPQALAERHTQAAQQFSVAARSHLDYKTVLITFLHSLAQPLAA